MISIIFIFNTQNKIFLNNTIISLSIELLVCTVLTLSFENISKSFLVKC